jgi:hypothetical protein
MKREPVLVEKTLSVSMMVVMDLVVEVAEW